VPKPQTKVRVLVLDTGDEAGVNGGKPTLEPWDGDRDRLLDPTAGHGKFVAGIYDARAGGVEVKVRRIMGGFGDVADWTAAEALYEEFGGIGAGGAAKPDEPEFHIVNASWGGPCEDDDPPIALAAAFLRLQERWGLRSPRAVDQSQRLRDARVIFVASAGNDASCREVWPASFTDVVAVGALGPDGPAPFTNYGSWVNACAPGVDIVSKFFDLDKEDTADPDEKAFRGWARWSGTSFAAPNVGAQIAFEAMATGSAVGLVAERLLFSPQHLRLWGLGTVVNVG
jgi:subtilisin family serine protease